MESLIELLEKSHRDSISKGFWDKDYFLLDPMNDKIRYDMNYLNNLVISQKVLLTITELSESIEALRKGKRAEINVYDRKVNEGFDKDLFEMLIKDSFEDELADTVIRIFDIANFYKIDLTRHIELKINYNETRERLHGKEF